MTFRANQLSVLALVHTTWKAAEESGQPKEEQSPQNCHTSNFLSGHVVRIGTAELAWGSVVIVAADCDDGWAGLHGWLGWRHEAGLTVHGLHGLSVHWGLSVHKFEFKFYNYYENLIFLD